MQETSKLNKSKHKRAIIAGIIGNVMEWYDFALYGYFAVIISKLFFPSESAIVSLLSTFAVFAAGFLMRPVGAALFGYIGDRMSRRKALFLSIIFMAIPTTALGLLPTHAQIGLAAPILLTVIRLIQGLSVGGEFSGSVTYLAEIAPIRKRGFFASFGNVGGNMGLLLGVGLSALVTTTLPHEAVLSWGWRMPFLFGGVLGVGGYFLRRGLSTTKVFASHETRHKNRSPFSEMIHENKRQTIVGILLAAGYGMFYYIAAVYLPTFLNTYFDVPLDLALRINTLGVFLLLCAVPIYGIISDRYIRRKHFIALSFIILAVIAYPFFSLLMTTYLAAMITVQVALLLLVGFIEGSAPAFFAELFDTEDRLTGYSISFNVGMGIVGGLTPMMATWFIKISGILYMPAILLITASFISGIALLFVKDRSRESLLENDRSG